MILDSNISKDILSYKSMQSLIFRSSYSIPLCWRFLFFNAIPHFIILRFSLFNSMILTIPRSRIQTFRKTRYPLKIRNSTIPQFFLIFPSLLINSIMLTILFFNAIPQFLIIFRSSLFNSMIFTIPRSQIQTFRETCYPLKICNSTILQFFLIFPSLLFNSIMLTISFYAIP